MGAENEESDHMQSVYRVFLARLGAPVRLPLR
jgi:hypothetical protein